MSGKLRDKLKVKVSGLRLKDMLQFKNLTLRRDKAIEAAEDKDIVTTFPINENAEALHPALQRMVVEDVIDMPECDARTLVMKKADGTPAAWFRAGQYVSLKLKIGDCCVTRPYSISSSPCSTKEGVVEITVKRSQGAFVSEYLIDEVKKGDHILISGPDGQFYHDRLRDSHNIVAVAGGSGITPFLSMARAIRDSVEDFNLTILFGSRTEKQILFKDELDRIQKATDKVKVVHVLSEDDKEGYEHGFIGSDLIKKYAPEDYSLFICGPEGLYRFMEKEVGKLGLPARRVRREILGSASLKVDNPKTFKLTVIQGPERFTIPARSDESVLVAMERSGIMAPSKCRSGECGWCRSMLISGDVTVLAGNDGRRAKDVETNHIHPCVSFPKSDIVLEVPRGDFPQEF